MTVPADIKGTHADYLVRLDAYQANPPLPAVERLRPYLTAEQFHGSRMVGVMRTLLGA